MRLQLPHGHGDVVAGVVVLGLSQPLLTENTNQNTPLTILECDINCAV